MSENNDMPIDVEILLAALLKTIGKSEVPVSAIFDDYSNFNIAVSQEKENSLIFELVEQKDVS